MQTSPLPTSDFLACPQNVFDPDLTHTGIFLEKAPGEQLFAVHPVSAFSMVECLFQQISHFRRCLFLNLVCGMGVGSKGEPCTAVTQHAGYSLNIDAILQGKGREGVPQVVEADMFQPGICKTQHILL